MNPSEQTHPEHIEPSLGFTRIGILIQTSGTGGQPTGRFFAERVDGRLKIDLLRDTYEGVCGTVEMLAYLEGSSGLYFLFTAGGRYYFWADGILAVHEKEFAGPKDFLEHALDGYENKPKVVVPMRAGADVEMSWWSK
ncbi:hypothetical protein B0H14DRAFT_3897007 [Mycena olivaceomarginata]|nr:hypothetical protein B0H14DRAFT_3897007 [Mycena olivaceomarginata]